MTKLGKFDRNIFMTIWAGAALGTAAGLVLHLWVIPEAANYRPATLSTILVPLGCFMGWLFSPSRERAATAVLVCFSLYVLSAFAAARLGTFENWNYFRTILGVQALGGTAMALVLGFAGRALPEVERLRASGAVTGLAELVRQGTPHQRLEAVRTLADLSKPQPHPAILAALDDSAAPVRREAARALIGQAGSEEVARLQVSLQDPDTVVQHLALEALGWIESPAAHQAVAGYWQHLLSTAPGRLWRQAAPLLLGGLLLLLSLTLPWNGTGQRLWGFGGGAIVALLLAGSALLAPAELAWGFGRRNLAGHLARLRIWAFLPAAALVLALLWPLQGPLVLKAQEGTLLGVGFWLASAGATLEFIGAFLIRG